MESSAPAAKTKLTPAIARRGWRPACTRLGDERRHAGLGAGHDRPCRSALACPRGRAAQDRARADPVRARLLLRLRIHRLERLSCRSRPRACCRTTSSSASRSTPACSATSAGGSRCRTWHLRRPVRIGLRWPSGCCSRSCSTRRSAPKASCARSTSTRWRCRFIVTGTAWKWILNPGLGIERVVRDLGFPSFTFDWLVNPDMAIYTVVIAGVWQSAGFVMALFLAGLRGIDDSIIKAAQIDGASLPRIYWRIIIPSLRPVFFCAVMILAPHRDQELRPGHGADRRRPGLRDRPAGDLHVHDGVHARPDRPRRRVGDDDARDRRGDRSCPTVLRTEPEPTR